MAKKIGWTIYVLCAGLEQQPWKRPLKLQIKVASIIIIIRVT
jgi:hypothetical protein